MQTAQEVGEAIRDTVEQYLAGKVDKPAFNAFIKQADATLDKLQAQKEKSKFFWKNYNETLLIKMPAQALKLAVELRRLRRRWDVYIAEPPPIELSPPLDYACVLEGLASTTDLDLDRVQLAPFALTWSGKVPLLIHHDFDRPAGEIKELSYTKDGSVHVSATLKAKVRVMVLSQSPSR